MEREVSSLATFTAAAGDFFFAEHLDANHCDTWTTNAMLNVYHVVPDDALASCGY